MLFNYLVTAWRNIVRHKLYAVINIGGLAVGLSACILILLFIRYEFSFDNWIPDHERIYRLHPTFNVPGRNPQRAVMSGAPFGKALEDNFSEVESATRLIYETPRVLQGDGAFDQRVTAADKNFFDVFDISLLEGDKTTALQDNRSIVLSESTAQRYFGVEPAIGKTISLCCYNAGQIDFRVTGILPDTPENSHLYFEAVYLLDEARYNDMDPLNLQSWSSMTVYTYVKLREGAQIETIFERLPWLLDNVMPGTEQTKEMFGINNSEIINLSFMPIQDIHLKAAPQAQSGADIRPLGDLTLVIGFLVIAFLILGIATINFLNLTTAQYINRSREVSMRKVLGANRKQIALHFLGESILTSFIALLVSFAIVQLTLPWFNVLLSSQIEFDLLGDYQTPLLFILLALLVGLVGGSYPTLFISNIRPTKTLQTAQPSAGKGPAKLKNALVVFQFSISIALIVATAVTFSQTEYVRSLNMGYDKENIVVLRGLSRSGAREVQNTIEARIEQMPQVVDSVRSAAVPTDHNGNNRIFSILGKEQDSGRQVINFNAVDYGFFELYGIEPVAGRTFSRDFGTDYPIATGQGEVRVGSVILNEIAVKRLGFQNNSDALGAIVVTEGLTGMGMNRTPEHLTIVGVVPNVNFASARSEAPPSLYLMSEMRFGSMSVKFRGNVEETLGEIEAIWKELAPSVPFSYSLLEEMVENQYTGEARQVLTFSGFSILAILISALGLYALAAFTVIRKTKEIGIRKIMGARISNILKLLLWQFSKPVVWANLIAWPVAWYFMNDWLSGFVYRIGLSPLFFVAAGLVALLIAWATVAGHAWRVARTNPIHALRYE